jgi:hypothetical protein
MNAIAGVVDGAMACAGTWLWHIGAHDIAPRDRPPRHSAPPPRKPISRARMAAAIAVHFIVPAYGLVLVADAALGHAPGTLAGWLPHALALGGRLCWPIAGCPPWPRGRHG